MRGFSGFDERTRGARLSLLMVGTFTGLGLVGCAATERARAPQPILIEDGHAAPAGDPVTLTGSELRGDTLQLHVAYVRGLREHEFSLNASGFMESSPVRVEVTLSHEPKGDAGEALINEVLAFDLSPLRRAYRAGYSDNGPIILQIFVPGQAESPSHTVRYEL